MQLAWTFDTQAPITQAAAPPTSAAGRDGRAGQKGSDQPAASRRPIMRKSEATPLVIGDVMYLSTGYSRVVALQLLHLLRSSPFG